MRLFRTNRTKVICAAFLHLQFGFEIVCRKKTGTKAAHKILVKVITVIYFTNILRTAFLNQRFFCNFSPLTA